MLNFFANLRNSKTHFFIQHLKWSSWSSNHLQNQNRIKFIFLTSTILLFVYIFLDASMYRACFWAYCMPLVHHPPHWTDGCIFLPPLAKSIGKTYFVLNKLFLNIFFLFSFILTSEVILHDLIYTLYLTYTGNGITGHIFIKFDALWFQEAPVISFLFIQHIIANINIVTFW